MKRTTLGALTAAALACPAALAAQNFDGPSIGLQLSYADAETTGPALEGGDALIGLRAYYDWDAGDYIVGAGVQYDAGDVDLSGAATIDDVFRLAGRIGVPSGQNWYYATAGYAYADTGGPANAGSSDGFFVGVGYEAFISDGVTAGAELLYHEFSDFSNIGTLDAEVVTLGLSLNYRF